MTTQPQSWSFPLQADNGPAPMLIDGSWLSSISGQTFPTYDRERERRSRTSRSVRRRMPRLRSRPPAVPSMKSGG